jgi:hypothetical protein
VVADRAAAESEDSGIENAESGSVPTVGGSGNTQLPDTALRGSQQRVGGTCAIRVKPSALQRSGGKSSSQTSGTIFS